MNRKIKYSLIVIAASLAASGLCAAADQTPAPSSTPEIMAIQTAPPAETAIPSETAAPETDTPALAESPEPSATATATKAPDISASTSLDLNFTLLQHAIVPENDMQLELYDMDGKLLSSASTHITVGMTSASVHFDVPEYKLGKTFNLKLIGGVRSIKFYDTLVQPGESVAMQTYGYMCTDGVYVKGNSFALESNPIYKKTVYAYVGGKSLSPGAVLIDGTTMVPAKSIAELLELSYKYDSDYNSVVCSVGSKQAIFNIGTTYSTILGKTVYAPHTPYFEGDTAYIPLRTLADAVGSKLDVYDHGERLDILVGASKLLADHRASSPVNAISSRTSYLVWVSKSEFKTRVYLGSKDNWVLQKTFTCGIGAPGTPTITGQFEYIERIPSWNYNGYYVGPVLRFHNGYALHSTLLYYGGGEYDGTVGRMISHGCIRLHPEDINWLDKNIPIGTRIYITN